MQGAAIEQLSSVEAEDILNKLPERIAEALRARAKEIQYPIERGVEMAILRSLAKPIASYLDSEALGFADCKPGRGQ